MGGQAHPAPFPSGARPAALTLPPAWPCSLRAHPHPLPESLTTPRPRPGPQPAQSVSPKLGTTGRRNGAGREAKAAAPPYPKWRRPNQQGREEGWTPSTSGLRVAHPTPPEQALAPLAALLEVGDRPGGAAPPASERRPPHFPPAPPPPGSRPSPDSALETTSPTYPLLLQIPCRAIVTPAPLLGRVRS